MKLASSSLQIDRIRLDGGTQVREGLDEAWVAELAELYREGHEIDPVLVVVETRGEEVIYWLADGFHRVAAKRRIGSNSIMATVRAGSAATLDMAKLLASAANKNGRPLQPGEKRRAVLMARSTPEGASMTIRELALHCGVKKSWVAEVIGGGCPAPDNSDSNCNYYGGAIRPGVGALWKRVDEALRADSEIADSEIARTLKCDRIVVGRRREALGLPKSDANKRRPAPTRDRAADVLREHPDWTNAKIADAAGSSPLTVAKLRDRIGVGPSPRGRKAPEPAASPPTAPARKGGDPRDGAEVIPMRRPEPPKADPCAGYSSMTIRDTADAVIRTFTAADLAVLAERIREQLASRQEDAS